MADYTIKATTRETFGKQVKKLRDQGMVPAVVYGDGYTNKSITIKKNEFVKMYNTAGESSIIDLVIDEKETIPTLIKVYDADPRTDEVLHVDFQKVDMSKKITANVDIVFIGEAPAAKNLGGTLVKKRDYVEIECLPSDLIHEITVDLSGLVSFDDVIHVSDLQVPETVEILDEPTGLVAKVEEQEVEEEAPAETVSVADIPTVAGEKKEEDAAAVAAAGESEKKE